MPLQASSRRHVGAAVGSAPCPRPCRSVSRSSPRRSSARRPTSPWETDADGGQALAEFAGRACYQAWDKVNPATATNEGYLRHILEVGHLAVLEHASVTHVPDRPVPVAGRTSSPGTGTSPTASCRSATSRRATPTFVEPAVIADDPDLHQAFLAAADAALAAHRTLLDGMEKALDGVPNATAAAQAGPAGGQLGAAHGDRDAPGRHRQLPRLAALHRDAGQRARRRRDPRGSRWPASASCSGSPATCSRTSGSAPSPTAPRSPPSPYVTEG